MRYNKLEYKNPQMKSWGMKGEWETFSLTFEHKGILGYLDFQVKEDDFEITKFRLKGVRKKLDKEIISNQKHQALLELLPFALNGKKEMFKFLRSSKTWQKRLNLPVKK